MRHESVCLIYCLNTFLFSVRFVGSLGSIIVKCKDLRVIQLDIPGMEECLNIASSIEVKKVLNISHSEGPDGASSREKRTSSCSY